jgi:hypothetical protein
MILIQWFLVSLRQVIVFVPSSSIIPSWFLLIRLDP